MRIARVSSFLVLTLIALVSVGAAVAARKAEKAADKWRFNATIIEACSCPMFCQCYFNTEPASHGGHGGHGGHGAEAGHAEAGGHFCKFNNAFRVNRGSHGGVNLADAKFWVAGDLGSEFSDGKLDWAVLTFDPAVTPEQREGIKKILAHLYPAEWASFTVAEDAPMEWAASRDRAVAKLDGGKAAEVVLKRQQGNTDDPIVIHNLKYWGAPRNDGFVLMPNEVEAYRLGDRAFEFRGTNGFMITLDMTSADVM